MPTYDYSCRSCGARFEAWQKMTDDPITICPTCGGAVHRIIYPVGLVFKGSGFYSTDNHAKSNGANGHQDNSNGTSHKEASSATAPAGSSPSDAGAAASAGSADAKSSAKAEPAASTAPAASPKG